MKVRVTDRTLPTTAKTSQVAGREGFVIPLVVFALAIMGVLAAAALRTADDEHRSSRALRESGSALYAAEAGMSIVRRTVTDTFGTTRFDSVRNAVSLESGDSTIWGWHSLPDGSSYRLLIQRTDSGGQVLHYVLTAEGRSRGFVGAQRAISVMLTGHVGNLATVNSVLGSTDGDGSPPLAATMNGNSFLLEGQDTQMPSATDPNNVPAGCGPPTSVNKIGFGVGSLESKGVIADEIDDDNKGQLRGKKQGTVNEYTSQNSYDTVATQPPDSIEAMVDALLPGATIWPSGQYSGTYGSPTAPGVFATTDGDLDFKGTGYGILIVTDGKFIMSGNAYWEGLILAVGPGAVRFTGSGNEFYGAIMVANTNGDATDLYVAGNAQLHYSSQALCRLEEFGLIGMSGIEVVPGTWTQLAR